MLISGKQAFVGGGGGGVKYESPKNNCVGG